MRLISVGRSGFPAAAMLTTADDGTELVLPVVARDRAGSFAPVSMNDVLGDWPSWSEQLTVIRAQAAQDSWRPIAEFDVLAPVPHPRSLICIGLNYRDHAAETGAAIPTNPVVFAKHRSAVGAPGTAIVLPALATEVYNQCNRLV